MKKFKRIYIEITNICNLQCSFCPPSKREQAFMSVQAFQNILFKIRGHGDFIYLHLKGEPLIHPEIEAILLACHEAGVRVNLTTNGTLLHQHKDLLLKSKALRQVSISLQSFEETDNHKAYEVYLYQVLDVIKTGQLNTNIIFELRLWNYDNPEAIVESSLLEADAHINAFRIIEKVLDLDTPIEKLIQKGKGIKLLPKVYLSKSHVFEWPDLSRACISQTGTCYGLRQQVGILVNGDVVPCCLDSEGDMVLGNIFEETMESIITSDRATALVKGFEENKLVEPLCQRCGYRTRFI